MTAATTLPELLAEQAAARPNAVALRQKRLGLWRSVTWDEYAATVDALALGLDAAGVLAGDRVAVFADNEPRWLYADLAIQRLGATTVAVYPALPPGDVAAVLGLASVSVAFCSDQEQVDNLLETGTLGGVRQLIVFEVKGLHIADYAQLPIEAFADLLERGRGIAAARPDRLREIAAGSAAAAAAASVSVTSGTSGSPKLALLGQAGQVELARVAARELGFSDHDRGYALLPLANATSRLFDAYVPLVAGSSLAFPESHETVPQDMVEAQPTVVVASPRLLERTRGEVELRAARAGWLKRRVARWGLKQLGVGAAAPGGGPAAALADLLIGRFVRTKAGLGHLRLALIGGAPLSGGLVDWFRAIRVPVREVYGQTEAGGPVTVQRSSTDAGTAGRPLGEGIELRLDGEELLVRSPGLLQGSLGGAPEAVEGWLRTGDLARIDAEGRLVPLGRASDVLVSSTGARLLPADAESALKSSPYVASAMVVADGRPFVTALLELNGDAIAEWARGAGVAVTTYASFATNDQVVALIEQEVVAANASLPDEQRVRRFRILPRPLADELTPTGKVRRDVLAEKYSPLLDEMYAENPERVSS
jgi:long-chain acyl-CoA synthetase